MLQDGVSERKESCLFGILHCEFWYEKVLGLIWQVINHSLLTESAFGCILTCCRFLCRRAEILILTIWRSVSTACISEEWEGYIFTGVCLSRGEGGYVWSLVYGLLSLVHSRGKGTPWSLVPGLFLGEGYPRQDQDRGTRSLSIPPPPDRTMQGGMDT